MQDIAWIPKDSGGGSMGWALGELEVCRVFGCIDMEIISRLGWIFERRKCVFGVDGGFQHFE